MPLPLPLPLTLTLPLPLPLPLLLPPPLTSPPFPTRLRHPTPLPDRPTTRPTVHPSNRPPVHPPVIAASNLSGPLPPSDEPYFQRLTPVLCDLWPLEFSSRASPSRNFASLAPSFSLRLSPSKNHLPFASFLLASPIGLLSRPLHLSISLFEAPGSLVYP